MGVNSLITWAVIDPVMRAVITETQSLSVVRTRASSLTFQMPTPNHAGCGFRTLPDTGFRLCVLRLQWCRDAGFDPRVLVLYWCKDTGFESRLGYYSAARTWASTLASWYCTIVEAQASSFLSWHYTSGYDWPHVWCLDFILWWLSSVIFRLFTASPSRRAQLFIAGYART